MPDRSHKPVYEGSIPSPATRMISPLRRALFISREIIMPYKPRKPCSHPGCSEVTNHPSGYCFLHTKLRQKQIDADRGTSNQRGYNYRWQKYRRSYLIEHPLCQRCLERGRIVEATVVDHIVPHRGGQELFWDSNNHQALCKKCHDEKTAREGWGSK